MNTQEQITLLFNELAQSSFAIEECAKTDDSWQLKSLDKQLNIVAGLSDDASQLTLRCELPHPTTDANQTFATLLWLNNESAMFGMTLGIDEADQPFQIVAVPTTDLNIAQMRSYVECFVARAVFVASMFAGGEDAHAEDSLSARVLIDPSLFA